MFRTRFALIAAVAAVLVLSPLDLRATGRQVGSDPVDSDHGKAVFSDAGCGRCHSVETQEIEASITSERMRGPDLSQIGSARSTDWLIAYVKREETIDGDRHRVPYNGSDDDLQVIAEWLEQLK